jgi:hypothetical protein
VRRHLAGQIFRLEAAPICPEALELRGSCILHFQGVCICRKISITADLKSLTYSGISIDAVIGITALLESFTMSERT